MKFLNYFFLLSVYADSVLTSKGKHLYLIKGMIQKIENPDEREKYLSYLQKNAKLRRAYIALVISLGIFQQRKEQIHNMLRRGELQFADLDPLWQSNTIGLLSVEEWLDFFNDIDKNKDEVIF